MPEETIPTPEFPAPPQSVEITCPNCHASLRNISVEPGAAIRCLNCGKRFTPAGGAQTAQSHEAAGAPELPRGKEPASAGYWLMRIPAMIVLLLSIVGYLFLFVVFVFAPYRSPQFYWQMIYSPLLPIGAAFFFLISRAMARIEASCLSIAWREEKLRDTLPPVSGSSLIYIGPLAVGGGLLPLVMLTAGQEMSVILPSLLFGGLLFYGGFMLEDVRQFVWRQGCLARTFSNKSQEGELYYMTGFWPALALLALCLSILIGSQRSNDQELIFTFVTLLLAGLACTAFLLGLNWDRTVHDWLRSARNPDARIDRIPSMLVMQITPLAWATLFFAVQMSMLTSRSYYRSSENVILFLLVIFGSSIPIFLSMFLLQLYRWRAAQCKVLDYSQITASQAYPWFKFFRIAVLALVAIQFVSLVMFSYYSIFRMRGFSRNIEEVIILLLFLVAAAYLPLWLLAITNEFLTVEALWAKRLATLREQDQ